LGDFDIIHRMMKNTTITSRNAMKPVPVHLPEETPPGLRDEEIRAFIDLFSRFLDFTYDVWARETGHAAKKLIRKGEDGRYEMAVDFPKLPEALEVISFLHDHFTELIEHFIDTKRTNEAQRDILEAWRSYGKTIMGVYVETVGERRAIFCDLERGTNYLVYTLYDPVTPFAEHRDILTTLLLPFAGRIVGDGLHIVHGRVDNDWGHYKLQKLYQTQRKRQGIITELAARSTSELSHRRILRLKISLRGAKPPIWRRLLIPANATLEDLHVAIQALFGWMEMHLFLFEDEWDRYSDPSLFEDTFSEGSVHDYRDVRVADLLQLVKDRITYIYDFGDHWKHTITLEAIEERDEKAFYPQCTGGRRAAPPEDCGGMWGYSALVEAYEEGDEEVLGSYGWALETFPDPARFDKKALNAHLKACFRNSL
jgi:hypothetical protein